MNERVDLYAILGLTPQASQAQINHAYRALLRRLHPDTRSLEDASPRDAADTALRQVLAAYAVLGDPHRRAAYDQRPTRARHHSQPRPNQPQRTPPDRAAVISTDGPAIQVGPVRWHTHRDT